MHPCCPQLAQELPRRRAAVAAPGRRWRSVRAAQQIVALQQRHPEYARTTRLQQVRLIAGPSLECSVTCAPKRVV
jgi:hypothetical protein